MLTNPIQSPELPKFYETFTPILKVLHDGQVLHYRTLQKIVVERFYSHLSKELLAETTTTGVNKIVGRIGWGKSYLKKAGFLEYPSRGMVKITKKGQEVLEKGSLTLQEVKQEPEYILRTSLTSKPKSNKDIKEEAYENETPQELISAGVVKLEQEIKDHLLTRLKDAPADFFEEATLKLLQKMGYGDYKGTHKSHDGGIDGIISQDQLGLDKIYIQCKRYNETKVTEPAIRDFIGAMSGDTQKGVFITTSTFDNKAINKAKDAHHRIILIDGAQLVDLMYKHSVGVQISDTYEIKKIDEDFFED